VPGETELLIVDDAGLLLGRTPAAATRIGVAPDLLSPGAALADIAALLPSGLRLRAAPLGNGMTAQIVESVLDEPPNAAAEIAMLRDTLDALDASVVVYDSQLRYRFGNRVYHQTFPHLPDDSVLAGETYAQVLGRSIDAGSVGDPQAYTDREAFIARRVAEVSDRWLGPYDIIGPGPDRTCQIRGQWTPSGNRVSLRIDTTNITRLHRELLAAQRMETIARLSGKIAHDFNNLLTVIIGNLELLQLTATTADAAALATAALAAAETGARLTGELLAAAPTLTPPTTSQAGTTPPVTGRITILMVEDDADVLATTARVLDGLGHHLLPASGAEQALTLLASDTVIDVLFTDVMMPDSRLNGVQLAHAARLLRPGLPVVLTSGYSADALDGGVPSGVTVLPKPYRIADLVAALAEIRK
jgi:CheY-like chemotaxis protein